MNITDTITQIENGTLPLEKWNHQAHLMLALYYVFTSNDMYVAHAKTRCSLIKYGVLTNPDYNCSLRYSETKTMFWVRQINLIVEKNKEKTLEEIGKIIAESKLSSSKYVYEYYTEELINTPRARATYVDPNK